MAIKIEAGLGSCVSCKVEPQCFNASGKREWRHTEAQDIVTGKSIVVPIRVCAARNPEEQKKLPCYKPRA